MRKVQLVEYLWFQEGPGVRNTQYTNNGIKLLNVSNLVEGKIDLSTSNRFISELEANTKYKHFLCDEGDLVIASSGIKVEYFDKKIGFVSKDMLPLCMNTSTIRFKPLNDNIIMKYVFYYFKSEDFKMQILKSITGSAQLNFGPTHIKRFHIIFYDLPKQQKIVEELDCLSDIIEKKKQQLADLDNLIKSQFIEMFGDSLNPKYSLTTFGDICTVRQGLQIAISKRKIEPAENRLKYITIQYLHGGKRTEYIENPKQSVICEEEDILMTRTGNTGMVVTNVNGVFHNNFFLIDFDRKLFNKIYLVNYLNLPEIQFEIIKRAGTSTIPDLNHSQFYQIRLIQPPIELQNKFADFVKNIEKSKNDIKQSIEETQNLFNERMQHYFGE